MAGPIASSRRRALVGVVLGVVGVVTMPVAVVVAERVSGIQLLDAAYAVPVAFLLGVVATGMGRRAKRNLAWFRLDDGGTVVASAAVTLGILAVSLALTAALSVGFYEAVRYYQRHH